MDKKKILSLVLAGALTLSGCSGGAREGTQVKLPDAEVAASWMDNMGLTASAEYKKTEYKPEYKDVQQDLSKALNASKISGFTEQQKQYLNKNGFVVMPQALPEGSFPQTYTKMYTMYETNEYLAFPSYITIDSSLNMYHLFFDGVLKDIEEGKLFVALQELTSDMFDKSKEAYTNEENEEVKIKLGRILKYFAVANSIINKNAEGLPEDLKENVENELALINEHSKMVDSYIVDAQVNYKQFTPRGHYTKTENLKTYFNIMMWYGLVPFNLEDDKGNVNIENAQDAATITYLAFLGEDHKDVKLWDKIYTPTKLFSGDSDDLNIFDIKDMVIEVYGEKSDYHHYYSDAYDKELEKAVKNLKEPDINSKITTNAEKAAKSFKFMGQRYTLDGNIMQDMMVQNKRPVPSGLDVATVFGDKKAESFAKEYTLEKLTADEYTKLADPLKKKVEGMDELKWKSNMYNGWLWVLESMFNVDKVKGLPKYMYTEAYKAKNINSALGSYTELKHDTVLYSKQPTAEKGGGPIEIEYPSVVEPQIEAYDRLIWLTDYSKENLISRGLLEKDTQLYYGIEELQKLYKQLRDIAVKQLEGKELTQEELEYLHVIGAYFEGMNNCFDEEGMTANLASGLVSDVAYIVDQGEFLELGTGYPDEIYVMVSHKGQPYIARGLVYSYYEFLNKEALTDEKWYGMMGIEKEGSRYNINSALFKKGLPERPKWIGEYYSNDANNVKIEEPEFIMH